MFKRILSLRNLRAIHTSTIKNHDARTYESAPVPGSLEHTHPNLWADRILKLKKLKESNPNAYDQLKPSPLNMICRVKKIKGIPFYERAILEKYGIGKDTKNYKYVPVINTPHVNSELMLVKHLIEVRQINFPNGLPDKNTDIMNCRLLQNGEFRITPSAEAVPIKDPEQLPTKEDIFKPISTNLNKRYLKARYHQDWTRKSFFSNFFSVSYQYKLNQDGREYRYSGLWRQDNAMKQSVKLRKNPDGTLNQNVAVRNNEADWNVYPWKNY